MTLWYVTRAGWCGRGGTARCPCPPIPINTGYPAPTKYEGHLAAFCDELRAKGVTFPVELKKRVNGSLLCYVAAPEGVSIELIKA